MTTERVLIVSAHTLFREGIVRLLGDQVEVVGAVSSWKEAEIVIQQRRPQAIIVDHEAADLQEADLAPLLWPDADDLRVIYVTLAGDKMMIHDRRRVTGAGEVDLLRALKDDRGETAQLPPSSSPGKLEPEVQKPQGRKNRMDRSKNRRHLIIVSALVGIVTLAVVLFLENSRLLPIGASAQAESVDWLLGWHIRVISFLFALIMVFILYSLIAFRRKPGDDSDGVHFHGNTTLEIVWTIVPLITVLVFGYLGAQGLTEVTGVKENEMVVEVTALQFAWQFAYPDSNVAGSNELVLPVDRPIHLKITSNDVIHDFWVPEFRVKQDAVPGLVTDLRIRPTEIGEYTVRCNELCGILHHAMLAPVRVVSQADFEAWLAEKVAAAGDQVDLSEAAQRGAELVVSTGCTACHNITGEPGGVGPTWKSLFGSQREFADGAIAVADEEYIRNSILNPNGQVVAGYIQGVMPQIYGDQLTGEQIGDIIEYIKSYGGE